MGKIKLTEKEKDLIKKNQKYIQNNDWDGFFNSLPSVYSDEWIAFSHIFQFCLECVPDLLYKISKIPNRAFSDSDIKSINIPSNIKEIGGCVFKRCENLKSVSIPNSVTEIGNYVFDGCKSLTNISIPDSVTEIGRNVFGGCKSLTNITIPDSTTIVWTDAFANSSFERISIPEHLLGQVSSWALPNYCEIHVRLNK